VCVCVRHFWQPLLRFNISKLQTWSNRGNESPSFVATVAMALAARAFIRHWGDSIAVVRSGIISRRNMRSPPSVPEVPSDQTFIKKIYLKLYYQQHTRCKKIRKSTTTMEEIQRCLTRHKDNSTSLARFQKPSINLGSVKTDLFPDCDDFATVLRLFLVHGQERDRHCVRRVRLHLVRIMPRNGLKTMCQKLNMYSKTA
jgi:hypothetical protein